MKRFLTMVICVVMVVLCAVPACAGTLEDNILEYGEIDGLIHTYNATVKQNGYRLNKYSGSGDDSVDDERTLKFSYDAAEMSLAKQAKSLMVTYYNTLLDTEQAQLNKELFQTNLQIAQTKAAVGMGTQLDILSATESLLNAEKTITTAQSALNETLKTLQVMCGWKYESIPELAPLPEPDVARIALMNPANDLATAIANNYTLRGNQRRLNNSSEDMDIDNYKITTDTNKQNIENSLNVAYANVIAARDAFVYAEANRKLEESNLAQMNVKYNIGSASRVELQSQNLTTRMAQIAAQKAKNNLLQAITNYDYEVAGLAGA